MVRVFISFYYVDPVWERGFNYTIKEVETDSKIDAEFVQKLLYQEAYEACTLLFYEILE
jgi:hypothetical protein